MLKIWPGKLQIQMCTCEHIPNYSKLRDLTIMTIRCASSSALALLKEVHNCRQIKMATHIVKN